MVGAIQIVGRSLPMAAMDPSKTAQICYFRTGLIVLVNNSNYIKNFCKGRCQKYTEGGGSDKVFKRFKL